MGYHYYFNVIILNFIIIKLSVRLLDVFRYKNELCARAWRLT